MLSKKSYISDVNNLSNFPSFEEMVDDDESLIPNAYEKSVGHLKIPSKSFDG